MIDRSVLDWVVAHRSPWLTDLFTVVTTAGNTVAVALGTVILAIVLATRGRRYEAVAAVVIMLVGWGVMNALKYVVRRSRPAVPDRLVEISTYSFPSGHAMMSAMFATLVILLVAGLRSSLRCSVVALALLASLAIGLSRVYLGAHWLTDVVAGWVFGALWVAVLWRAVTARHTTAGDQRSR